MLDKDTQARIVSSANLAPSVHNTQPARWRFDSDGSITILADETRLLRIGDPTGRDAGLSCGAAIEGTVMALADIGRKVVSVDDLWGIEASRHGLRPVARIVLDGETQPFPLSSQIQKRFTWRSLFQDIPGEAKRTLQNGAHEQDDIILAVDSVDCQMLADLNDQASLRVYRDRDYRLELVSWMRLTRRHPRYFSDGLNLEALQISAIEGHAARLVLGTGLYSLVDRAGISGPMLSERTKTLSATAIVLFHRPREESPIVTGRAFYRMWLNLARLGLAAWPMAVLADDEAASAECCTRFGITVDRRFITALRVGAATKQVERARLPISSLIITGT